MTASEVEQRIEELCLSFEEGKPYLTALWAGKPLPHLSPRAPQSEPPGLEVSKS